MRLKCTPVVQGCWRVVVVNTLSPPQPALLQERSEEFDAGPSFPCTLCRRALVSFY